MTIDLVNVLDSKCSLRMLERGFQSMKISKLSGGAGPRPHSSSCLRLSRHSSMTEKYSNLHTQKVGQSAIFMAKFLSLATQNAFLAGPPSHSPQGPPERSPPIGRWVSLSHNFLEWLPHIKLWHDNPPSSVSSLGGVVLLMALDSNSVYSWILLYGHSFVPGERKPLYFLKVTFYGPISVCINSVWLYHYFQHLTGTLTT